MAKHLTKRIEIFCEVNQSSIYVEQDLEFGGVNLVFGEAWGKHETTLDTEMAESLIKALKEIGVKEE